MKRFLSFMMAAGLLVGAAACSNDDPEPEPIPERSEVIEKIFGGSTPEYVSGSVTAPAEAEAGAVIALPEFTALYPWEMTVESVLSPAAKATLARAEAEGYAFQLSFYETGADAATTLSGTANGAKVQCYLVAPEAPAYLQGNSTGDVTLTMLTDAASNKTEEFTLYKAFVGEVDVTIAIEAAAFEDGEFIFAEDGSGYEYVSLEEDTIELFWTIGGAWYQRPVKITADFDFDIQNAPEWLDVANERREDGVYTASFRAATYKIDDPTGEIVLVSARDDEKKGVEIRYPVTIPNYGEIFDMIPGTSYKFDVEGSAITDETSLGSTTKWFSSVEGGKAYFFEKVSQYGSSYYAPADASTWMHVTFEDAEEDPAALVRTIKATVSVDENTGFAAREGLVLYLPPFAFGQLGFGEEAFADGLDADAASGVLADYVFGTIAQEGKEVLSITDEEREEYENELGIFFTKSSADAWFKNNYSFNGVYGFYELAFTSSWNNDDYAPLHLDETFGGKEITFEYYDGDATPIEAFDDDEPTAPNWLQAAALGLNGTNLKFYMYPKYDTFQSPDYAHEGFVLVLADGKPVVCVHCIYDESYVAGGGDNQPGSTDISFVNPNQEGADLIQISENNLDVFGIELNDYLEMNNAGVKMIGLSFWATQEAELNVPAGYYVMYNPYGISWLYGGVEYGEYSKSTMKVTMQAPGENDPKFGSIQFAANLSSSFPAVVIFCKPAFAD